MNFLSKNNIDKAHAILKPIILKTPLITNDTINNIVRAKVYFKLENLQVTGSFKIRGAAYKISKLSKIQKKNGLVAYSSGNHGQAVAFISQNAGINSTIIMPKDAPKIKIMNTKKYNSKIILYDPQKEKREIIGEKIQKEFNKTLIKPYDDFDIITGQGTVGKEIVEQIKIIKEKPDIYLCCVSGGGLIAGSSFYLKNSFPNIKCFSVEPEGYDDTLLSLKKNKIVSNKKMPKTICDALLMPQPGKITFSINKKILSKGFKVSDYEVKKTIKLLSEELKIAVEPGGAVAAAALLCNRINVQGKTVIVMISGGNIDDNTFKNIIKNNYE